MKEKLQKLLETPFHSVQISQLKKGISKEYTKVTIKPFFSKDKTMYQITYVYPKKVTHENVDFPQLVDKIVCFLSEEFVQCQVYGRDKDYHVTNFKSLVIRTKNPTKNVEIAQHNRQKEYIITQDENADFLQELGVVNLDGSISKDKYDKFRQINRYLEFVADLKDNFPKNGKINIVDFGCGKSYLTFALYYYLTKKLNLNVNIIGLDLKKDVIEHCQNLAERLGYSGLKFMYGDIKNFESDVQIHMVVSLHACDTATDEAFAKALLWKSPIILAVPCCQHELNKQLKSDVNDGLLGYGLIRERLSTLLTDTSRALLLESVGYKTDIVEFIDMEHTPKNILIRCVKRGKKSTQSYDKYLKLKAEYGFEHTLEKRIKALNLL